jgi:ATP-binding cassette subfamily C (CFTR/MRP) protein 1
MQKLLNRGYKRALADKDLNRLGPGDDAHSCSSQLQAKWDEELTRPNPSLLRALRRTFGRSFALAGIAFLFFYAFQLSVPILMQYLLQTISSASSQNPSEPPLPLWHGIAYALAMTAALILQSVSVNLYWFMSYRIGMRVRTALTALVYRKSFVLDSESKQKRTVGEMVNFQAIDCQRFLDLLPVLHNVYVSPAVIILAAALLYTFVGPSVFAGLSLMIGMVLLNLFLAKKVAFRQKSVMTHRDKRANLLNEILLGIRIIKMFAWERAYGEKVEEVRQNELKLLRNLAMYRIAPISLVSSSPTLVGFFTFATFVLAGNTLTIENVFPSLALFVIIRYPVNIFPQVIQGTLDARIALGRLQTFLTSPEVDPSSVERNAHGNAIELDDATIAWGKQSVLHSIDLTVPRGGIVAIVGNVGSGKSSLLESLLGNMKRVSGRIAVQGTIAYAPQQAWIQNATLRDNILFGKAYDEVEYERVIRMCELVRDIEALASGDQTEIGEKGINLSGGQKQRVNCARAAYQNADIYLFDDPLSALDSQVGASLFHNLILRHLREKTRVLVTHQVQHLSQVDEIIVLSEGRIVERGNFEQLAQAGGEFARLLRDVTVAEHQEQQEKEQPLKQAKESAKIIVQEDRALGSLSSNVYMDYLRAVGFSSVAVITTMFVVENSLRIASDYWLSYWAEQADPGMSVPLFVGVFGGIAAVYVILCHSRTLAVLLGSLNASRSTHQRMLWSVLRSPISFFDSTPVGRILNRFTRDQFSVDEGVPRILLQFTLTTFFSLVSFLIVIAVATPSFLVAIFPLAYLYLRVQRFYIRASLELKRLDSLSRSPIYALFSETLNGASTITAYRGAIDRFVVLNEGHLDRNNRAYFLGQTASRWLQLRLEMLGILVVTFASIFSVLTRSTISMANAGLSVNYALQFSMAVNRFILDFTETQSQFISVERVTEYDELESEAELINPNHRPRAEWPEEGSIVFENVSMRYRAAMPLVLRDVSLEVRPREKVGVCGRTGAGKSSMMTALFRLVELEQGRIMIDGVDISKIGLEDLRSRLSIIPQEPTLFKGTMRSNLDPFDQYSDAQLWDALEGTYMRSYVEKNGGLVCAVSEGGANMSVGQRQLVCLARALLRKARILVMDEATAAIDLDTDSLIQKTISNAFANSTVLTIAHRLDTILHYDRILVLDRGQVAQFDTPANLASQPGIFATLLQHSGHTLAEK